MGTKLDEFQEETLQQLAEALGAVVVSEFDSRVTHVVTAALKSQDSKLPARTFKYFFGLVGRKHVVTYDCKCFSLLSPARNVY